MRKQRKTGRNVPHVPTHQQGDLSLPDDVDDVLVLLRLLVHLSVRSTEPPHADSSPSRSPGFGGVLFAHAAHLRPRPLGVREDARRQEFVWKQGHRVRTSPPDARRRIKK